MFIDVLFQIKIVRARSNTVFGLNGSRRLISGSTADGSSSKFDLGLTENQLQIQETARKFTREEIIPNAAKYDSSSEFPWDIVKKAHSIGLMNAHVPEQFGGLGLSTFDGCLISEEFSFGCTGITLAIVGTELGVGFYLAAVRRCLVD